MTDNDIPPIYHHDDIPWQRHPRFQDVFFKPLIKGAENTFASVGMVRVPAGAEIGLHIHPQEIETIYVMAGHGVFHVGGEERPVREGDIVSVPIGMTHGLRNESQEDVQLLTIFTPPIF
ncbi:MAG: cupin domain-containing protein [Caldilineae bacterium]|nr:MAG: cupin domain-containing protein [Caldilineae bacterium]